jgi:hypothetical protein
MRDAALVGARLLLGGYMGIHASQKLFGKFNGPGKYKPAPAAVAAEPPAADA